MQPLFYSSPVGEELERTSCLLGGVSFYPSVGDNAGTHRLHLQVQHSLHLKHELYKMIHQRA